MTCRRHRMIPKNRFWGRTNIPQARKWPLQSTICLLIIISFLDFLWRRHAHFHTLKDCVACHNSPASNTYKTFFLPGKSAIYMFSGEIIIQTSETKKSNFPRWWGGTLALHSRYASPRLGDTRRGQSGAFFIGLTLSYTDRNRGSNLSYPRIII